MEAHDNEVRSQFVSSFEDINIDRGFRAASTSDMLN